MSFISQSVEWEAMMSRRAQRLTDEPCRGCGKHAGESKDAFWRACDTCAFEYMWLGVNPPNCQDGL